MLFKNSSTYLSVHTNDSPGAMFNFLTGSGGCFKAIWLHYAAPVGLVCLKQHLGRFVQIHVDKNFSETDALCMILLLSNDMAEIFVFITSTGPKTLTKHSGFMHEFAFLLWYQYVHVGKMTNKSEKPWMISEITVVSNHLLPSVFNFTGTCWLDDFLCVLTLLSLVCYVIHPAHARALWNRLSF